MAKLTPCDTPDINGVYGCPYKDTYGGYEDEMCRNCCGLGVDEDIPDDYEPEDWPIIREEL